MNNLNLAAKWFADNNRNYLLWLIELFGSKPEHQLNDKNVAKEIHRVLTSPSRFIREIKEEQFRKVNQEKSGKVVS